MSVITIVNPKGGVGKSTLATQLAGWSAGQGWRTALGDLDRQQSAHQWLALRPPEMAAIQLWEACLGADQDLRLPKRFDVGVLDTPAGLRGKKLAAVLGVSRCLLVPLQASLFDIQATHGLLDALRETPGGRRLPIGLVAMRVKEGTQALERLREYAATLEVPLLTQLRDTQNYVHLAAQGLTLWDVLPGRVAPDLDQWQPLLSWLKPVLPGASA